MMKIAIILTSMLLVQNAGQNNIDELLGWLNGVWYADQGKKITGEEWHRISANTYEGRGYIIQESGNDTTVFESLRLLKMHDDIFYLAYVKHNSLPVAFKLTRTNNDSTFFENAAHDFPQKIVYIKTGSNSFSVHVEGVENGVLRYFELKFRKAED